MFDFAWSEIALIGVVALIAIGPKDMPVAIKAVTTAIKKARRMAGEFQTHVDDMMREADLHDVKKSFDEVRRFDFKGTVERAVDPDGSLRSTLAKKPLAADPVINVPPTIPPEVVEGNAAVAELADPEAAGTVSLPLGSAHGASQPWEAEAEVGAEAPAFIPPAFAVRPEPPPDFVPPNVTRRSVARV